MKILKIVGIIIAAIVVIFFAAGMIKSEISYESEVMIEKPVEEVWAIMQDESRISEWLEEVQRIEHISGEPRSVGAISKIYVEENGQEMFMEEEITSIVENKHMAMTFTMDFMTMKYEMNLEDLNGKTKVNSSSVTYGNSMFAKSILAFMGGTMKDQEDHNLKKLKTLVEENTKNYGF